MTTQETLMDMYQALRAHFGHQNWWPGETPLEIALGAILTQNTNWRNVERAIDHLKAAGCLDVGRLAEMHHAPLAELIRPAGYYNVKARRLKNFIDRVRHECADDVAGFLDRPVPELRQDLLTVNGIGRETADSMILYAAGKPSFVVDAYTRRIALRHLLIAEQDDYEAIKELFETALPEDVRLWNDYHAQLVAVGKDFCRPKTPRCASCPLNPFPHETEPDEWM
jgi:endonuclease-3 related protein